MPNMAVFLHGIDVKIMASENSVWLLTLENHYITGVLLNYSLTFDVYFQTSLVLIRCVKSVKFTDTNKKKITFRMCISNSCDEVCRNVSNIHDSFYIFMLN